jgi:hypothetical protein
VYLQEDKSKMKKFSVALLALATAIAISPAAKADTYDFTMVTVTGNVTADFSISADLSGGVYTASGGTVDLTGAPASGVFNLTLGSGGSPSGLFNYDNWFDPTTTYFDTTGPLFTDAAGDEFNVWSNGDGSWSLDEEVGNNYVMEDIATPEPSSLLFLGTGLLVLAFILFRKHKPFGMNLNS